MRTQFVVASAAVVAGLAGWWARGIEWAPIDSAPAVAVAHRNVSREAAPSFAIEHHATQPRASHGSRNLFAYREEPTPFQRAIYHAPPPVLIERAAPPPNPVVVEAKPRLRFTSRYIGRFGPDRNPIAAFTRDGVVTTVRIGEPIDEHFVLRRIGIESVEVEARDDGEVITQQVPLG